MKLSSVVAIIAFGFQSHAFASQAVGESCANFTGTYKATCIGSSVGAGGLMFPKKVDTEIFTPLLPFCPPQILLG